jgi:hypothetical protein
LLLAFEVGKGRECCHIKSKTIIINHHYSDF